MGKGCNNTLPSQISLNNMDDLTGQKVPKNYNSLRQKSTDCYFEQHDRPDVGTSGLSKIEGATVMEERDTSLRVQQLTRAILLKHLSVLLERVTQNATNLS